MLCCILQLLYILSINYKCLTKDKRLDMSGDPKNTVQAQWRCYFWIFLDVISAWRHQSFDPLVPGQHQQKCTPNVSKYITIYKYKIHLYFEIQVYIYIIVHVNSKAYATTINVKFTIPATLCKRVHELLRISDYLL